MAESLLFRKGSLAGLESANLVAGAISFTTDEPAIYLDVQENGEVVRKRIGDLIVYNTAEELIAAGNTAVAGTVGSWSTTALYYIVSNNALMKWNGSKWTQINSVSEIEAEFNELDKIINGDSTVPGDTGLVGQVSSLGNRIDQAESDIDALQGNVGDSRDVYIPPKGEQPAGGDDTLWGHLNAEIERSTAKDSAHDEALVTLREDLENIIGEVPEDTDLWAALQAEIIRSTNKDTEHDNLLKSMGDSDDVYVAPVEGQPAKDDTLWGHLNAEIARSTAKDTAHDGALESLDGRVDVLEGYVGVPKKDANTPATGLHLTVDNNTASITALSNKLDGYKNTWETEHTNIRNDFAAADTALKTELRGYIDTNMATADAMKYMGVVNSADGLPTTAKAIEAGWTYKVGADFAATDKIATDEAVILKGDLLIASDDLAVGATIPNDFWHHISSGYEDDKDQILVGSTVAASGTKTAGAQVILQSHTKDDRGSVAIVGTTNSNVRVTSAVTVDNEQTGDTSTVITLGLEWGEF